METLTVTSPLTTGQAVFKAQQRLNGNNKQKKDFLQGPVDGIFGEETGRACKRAKYWLGYPTDEITATYGDSLDGYLDGTAKPTEEMVKRRQLRMEEQHQKPLRAQALEEARRHRGVKESPAGSNKVLFSDWYGIRGPWCAMFVTYCYVKAGSKAFLKGRRWAYVPYIVNDARAGRNGLIATRAPLPGDVVCYDWDGGVADHTGFFVNWDVKDKGTFVALEGNTAIGNDSNGGEVMLRQRNVRQVECFVRVAH